MSVFNRPQPTRNEFDSRNPRSFFIYLLDNGVSVMDYSERMSTYTRASMVPYPQRKFNAYAYLWPDLWDAYKAMCSLTDTQPH